MDPQAAEEQVNLGGVAFVIILLFVLGMVAPNVGVMQQCSDNFLLFRPYCVAEESWKTISNLNLFQPKICKNLEITREVRNTAISVVDESTEMNVGQVIELYSWVNENIGYVSDPSTGEYFATAEETLEVKKGDCDDHAILMTNMLNSVGGVSKLVIAPDCNHAFSAVYVTSDEDYFTEVLLNIREIYQTEYERSIGDMSFYVDEDGYWVIADPAGGNYLGDILPECENEEFQPIC